MTWQERMSPTWRMIWRAPKGGLCHYPSRAAAPAMEGTDPRQIAWAGELNSRAVLGAVGEALRSSDRHSQALKTQIASLYCSRASTILQEVLLSYASSIALRFGYFPGSSPPCPAPMRCLRIRRLASSAGGVSMSVVSNEGDQGRVLIACRGYQSWKIVMQADFV